MKLLLDTHMVIWALTGDRRLSSKIINMILDESNAVYFSVVSLWEIAIKNSKSLEKCPYDEQTINKQCIESGYELLDLHPEHIFEVRSLKTKPQCTLSNMDPFDRILISQAKAEGMHILSADSNFINYDEPCIFTV